MSSLRRPSVFACVAMSLAATACTPESPHPLLTGVSPQWGYSGTQTEVWVEGQNFLPRLEALGAQDISVDAEFSLVLETTPPTALGQVVRTSDSSLSAVIPAGLSPGRYGLSVTGPTGAKGHLPDAFTVTDTRAATIGISTPAVRFDVREDARAELQLRDLSGTEVPAPVEIEVIAVTASADPSFVVFQEGLVDQEAVGPGHIRGSLDSGGGADLYFTSTAVDDVALLVRGLGLNDHIEVMGPQVRFEPATIAGATITLSETELTAGEPVSVTVRLLDADGNPTRGELLVATLLETCSVGSSGFATVVTLPDQLTIPDVRLTGATVAGGCSENRLRLVGAVSGEPFVAESAPLQIQPGPLNRYQVTPIAPEVVAGTQAQDLIVQAQDLWTNPIPDHSATLTLTDDVGGLDPEAGIGSAECGGFSDGRTVCSAILERAADAVTVTVLDEFGVPGVSSPFRVVAGPPVSLDVSGPTAPVVAGTVFLVSTQAYDALGNPSGLEAVGGPSAVVLSDTTGSLACTARFQGPAPGLLLSVCTITTADPSTAIQADLAALGLSASSPSFEVTNAEVDQIAFTLDQSTLTAGDPLDFQLAATDAFGNPYVHQTTGSVLVDDVGGELAPTSVSLDAVGEGSGTVSPVRATAANALQARVFGSIRGQSDPFSVDAGAHSAYTVDIGTSWVPLDTATSVRVTAVDAYGNRVATAATTVSMESSSSAGDRLSGVVLAAGEAQADFTWDSPALQDVLHVTDGILSGTSSATDAVDLACDDGPLADLTAASETDLRLCLVTGQTSEVTVSAAASVAGAVDLAAYHLDNGDGDQSRSTTPTWVERWSGEGARVLEAVVVDDAGCADRAYATVWIGLSDGEPVGPVSVVLDETSLTAGSASGGTTTAALAAWDCAGDPASGGTLGVRTDLGTVSSAATTVVSSGSGLEVVLDTNGQAEVEWSVASVDVAGSPSLHAGVPSGAAYGGAAVAVNGDARRPIPVEVFPVGTTTDTWPALILAFSEPMLSSSVTTSAFALEDPDGIEVGFTSATLSTDGRTATLTPGRALDGSEGVWTLTAESTLRDAEGGNFLDGAWSGAASDFTVALGNVTESASPVTGCTPSTTRFRPDGDPGTGSDADHVDFSVVAAAVPTWWWLTVADADGSVIAWEPAAAVGASTTLRWTGHGTDGMIVEAGEYTVSVQALDAVLAENTACSNVITIEHPIDAPERP